jgi:hypothetical protein
MTSLYTINYYAAGANYGSIYFFGLLNPPTGAQTINYTSSLAMDFAASSVSYNNVSSFGTVTAANSGNASNVPTMTVSGTAVHQMVAQAFGGLSFTFTGYNQTQRVNLVPGYVPLVMGDAPGAPSITFSGTQSDVWCGVAVPLLP